VAKTKQALEGLGLAADHQLPTCDQYEQAATCLKEGIVQLNSLGVWACNRPSWFILMYFQIEPLSTDQLNEEIAEAIEKDKAGIDKLLAPVAKMVSPALKQINFYWLRRPDQVLKTIVDEPDMRIGMRVY
jgi:hypothetical protein